MTAPEVFVEHLRQEGYHPRSNKHSNALCRAILEDLQARCHPFAGHAGSGAIVFELNQRVRVGHSEWNIDLLVGPPPTTFPAPGAGHIAKAVPSTIRFACEAKCIMTEHKKAQRNRLRDLDSFHQFVHRYDPNTITAGVTILNIATSFRSPLRPRVTTHKNPVALVEEGIGLMRTLPVRAMPGDPPGLEANAVIIVSHENQKLRTSRLHTGRPAPQVGDPVHYDSFVQRICEIYRQRWG